MSHFTVLVIGPNPEAQLAPYDENLRVDTYPAEVGEWSLSYHEKKLKEAHPDLTEIPLEMIAKDLAESDECEHFVRDGKIYYNTTLNPNGHWDWYALGGRWRGFFPLKEGVVFSTKMLGELGLGELMMQERGETLPDYAAERKVDCATLGQIDFERARNEAEEQARARFAIWRESFERHGRPQAWSEFLARMEEEIALLEERGVADEVIGSKTVPAIFRGEPERTHDVSRRNEVQTRFREKYREQPAIAAHQEASFMFECPVDWFGFDEETFVRKQRLSALVPYALVKDGKWYARGKMGWFGCSSDEKGRDVWSEEVHRLYDDLPPDTVVSLFDCHT